MLLIMHIIVEGGLMSCSLARGSPVCHQMDHILFDQCTSFKQCIVYPGMPCHPVSLKLLLLPIFFCVCQILHLKS